MYNALKMFQQNIAIIVATSESPVQNLNNNTFIVLFYIFYIFIKRKNAVKKYFNEYLIYLKRTLQKRINYYFFFLNFCSCLIFLYILIK